jgi:fructan beta-fructosidase
MDLVELPVDGDKQNMKWVMYDASFDYEIGDFNGEKFTSDEVVLKGDYGFHYYAAQSFNDSPDGRRVMIGWLNDRKHSPFVATKMPFDQQMSIPTEMSLRTTAEGVRLFRWPIKEIESLYLKTEKFSQLNLEAANENLAKMSANLIDISIELVPKGDLEFNLRGIRVKYDHKAQTIQPLKILNPHHKGRKLPAPIQKGVLKLRILVDRASIEIFVNEGATVGTYLGLTEEDNRTVQISGDKTTVVNSVVFNQLKSAWEAK